MKPFKFIIDNSKKYLPFCIVLSLISCVSSLCYIGLALFSKAILDNNGNFLKNCILLFAVILLQVILHILKSRLSAVTSGKLDICFKSNAFNLFLNKNYGETLKYHSGEVVNRLTSDIEIIINFLVNAVPAFIGFLTKIIAGIAVLIYFNTYIGITVLIIGTVIAFLGKFIGPKYKKAHNCVQQQNGIVKSFFQECIQNIVVIKTFFNNSFPSLHLSKSLKNRYNAKLKKNSLDIIIVSGLYLIFTAGYYSTLIWCAIGVKNNIITVGTLISFLQIISQIKAPLYNISGIAPQYFSAITSAQRLIELENLKGEELNTELNFEELYGNLTSIEAENISFAYENEPNTINGSSFSIKKGGIVAITGESGAGKSTLFKLLLGLYNSTDGKLYLKTNGTNIAINSKTRKLFSYVPQGNMILSGTIKENIMFGNNTATEQDFTNACKIALVDEFVNSLPEKYNTYLYEKGMGLSEGQIQRIAIARAVLSKAPIILFDECTSALDKNTEREVLYNIKTSLNKTVFLISHKPAVLEICTDILKIEDGIFKQEII